MNRILLPMIVALLGLALGLADAAEQSRPVLQIINGGSQPLDIFWLKTPGERVPNGSLAPGKETSITTTLGHRFAVVGRVDKSESVITSEVPVQAFRVGGVPAFYTQRVEAHGFPIVGSANVNPYALKEAACLVDLMLAKRPDVRDAMIKSGSRMRVLAWNEFTTDQPEFTRLGEEKMPDFPGLPGKDYWDARARGLGGSATDPLCSCAEENLLGYPGDPYAAECIVIHEFAHNIHLRGMNNVDPTFDARLQAAYDAAMKAGLWKGKYAATNHHEYFAEGVQSWFDNNRFNDHDHNHVHLRSQLIEYDPGLAAMCREVFGDTEIKYTKPATRLTGHLAGYDPAKAPTFVWPARLTEAKKRIRETAESRDEKANGASTAKPNVLFIALDDLNDWVGCLGGHPQTKTPNIDRLAKSGVLFTNAHCAAPSCNPSRTAIFTGVPPYCSGLYDNRQKLRDVLPQTELLPRHFSRNGYWSAGSGKLLHYIIEPQSWDDYFPEKAKDDPFPRTFDPAKRPVSLPVGGPWQYVDTDWGALDVTDEQYGGDWLVTKWIGEQLQRKHDKPFFLACGIYKPHEPWFVPGKYFEPFPLESIQAGPGYKADDLNDVPPAGQQLARNRYFPHIQQQGQWKNGIQAYLAAIHFADAMVGRVLDALEKSPQRDNTIVVLWSDHGWHLGEKEHWQKFTGWRLCTRVPLIIRVPKGAPGLPEGTAASGVCDRAVSLTDLFQTLTDLCELPASQNKDASERSLVPLLRDPKAAWPHAAITQLQTPETYSVSRDHWRYIHYAGGDEELYDVAADSHEWANLLHGKAVPEHKVLAAELRALAPKNPAPVAAVPLASLTGLEWHPASDGETPRSKPDGNPFDVTFVNSREQSVELMWMTPEGGAKSYGTIEPTKTKRQQTRPGAVWEIRSENGERLGYFIVGDRTAKAVIPDGDPAQRSNIKTNQ